MGYPGPGEQDNHSKECYDDEDFCDHPTDHRLYWVMGYDCPCVWGYLD